MSQLVRKTVNERQVVNMNLLCKGLVLTLGLAVLAVGISLFVIGVLRNGWTVRMAPYYACMGLIIIGGAVLSALTLARMIDSCRKKHQFQEDVNEVR